MKFAKTLMVFLTCLYTSRTVAQDKIVFHSLDEVLAFSESRSIAFRNADKHSKLAKYQTQGSRLEAFNLKGQGSLRLIDNTKLGADFMPGELFGGPAGTFKPIAFGQKYVTNISFDPQIDLINPYALAKIKVAKTNEQLTSVNNLISRKDVYESIATVYFNICSYQWQIIVTKQILSNSDTLLAIIQNRYSEGVSRVQDVNLAKVNQLTVKDKIQQLEAQLEYQYYSLKTLCDIDTSATIIIEVQKGSADGISYTVEATGNLLQRQAEWKTRYHEAMLRADKRWMYPILNLYSSFSWQESNNQSFLGTSNWIPANFIGLKVSIPIVPDASKIATVKSDRLNLEIARNNWNHQKLQEQINNTQLELDNRKAGQSYLYAAEIENLREDTYQKNLAIYKEGIIPTTDIITSLNEWLNSKMNAVAMLATVHYTKSKIIIANTVK